MINIDGRIFTSPAEAVEFMLGMNSHHKEQVCDCGQSAIYSVWNPDGQELHLCAICLVREHAVPVKNMVQMLEDSL